MLSQSPTMATTNLQALQGVTEVTLTKSLHAAAVVGNGKPYSKKIIDSNNAGAALMEKGNYLAAIRTLEKAMQRFKKVYPSVRKQSQQQEDAQQLDRSDLDGLFSWSFCSEDSSTDQDQAHMYSAPVRLPADSFPFTLATCGFVSMAICLNLALAHHLCGQELLTEYSEPTTVAMRHFMASSHYYDFTIRLARAQSSLAAQMKNNNDEAAAATSNSLNANTEAFSSAQQQQQVPLVSPFLLMVCLNNMGQLHQHHLNNAQRSQECYLQLQKALLSLLIARDGDVGYTTGEQQRSRQQQQQPRRRPSATSSSANAVANAAAATESDTTTTHPSTNSDNNNPNMPILSRDDLSQFLQNVAMGLCMVDLGQTAAAA